MLAHFTRERDQLLFLAGQYTGLRISELLSLTVGQVSAGGLRYKSEIVVGRNALKGGTGRYRRRVTSRAIPMHPDLGGLILAYLSSYPGGFPKLTAPLFPSRKGDGKPIGRKYVWKLYKDSAVSAGINADRISTHSTRKTYSLEIYKASGHDPIAVQRLLGHASLNTTVKYLEPDEDRLKSLVLGLRNRSAAPAQPTRAIIPDLADMLAAKARDAK